MIIFGIDINVFLKAEQGPYYSGEKNYPTHKAYGLSFPTKTRTCHTYKKKVIAGFLGLYKCISKVDPEIYDSSISYDLLVKTLP